MNLPKMDIHPYAELFPQMTPDEWETFVADIHANGVLTPITLFQGKILDGRHRWTAIEEIAEKHGIEAKPPFNCTIFEGTEAEALTYVYSANIHRRHLTTGQRACLGVEVKRHLQETIHAGGDKRSEEYHSCKNARMVEANDAADIAADTVNVSRRSIYKAEKIQEEAPDLFERVRAGEMPLGAAETALAVRNGTQTQSQAIRACVSEVIQSIGAEAITEEKLEKVSRVLADETTNIHVSDDSYEWYTPAHVIELARNVLGAIDCDPASCELANRTVQAETFFTKEQNGLLQEWQGRVWLNPPYNMPLVQQFTEKCLEEYNCNRVRTAIILVNNATDTAWFQAMLSQFPVCFPSGRLHFDNGRTGEKGMQTRQGQAIFYLFDILDSGDSIARFCETFSQIGTVLLPYGGNQ